MTKIDFEDKKLFKKLKFSQGSCRAIINVIQSLTSVEFNYELAG